MISHELTPASFSSNQHRRTGKVFLSRTFNLSVLWMERYDTITFLRWVAPFEKTSSSPELWLKFQVHPKTWNTNDPEWCCAPTVGGIIADQLPRYVAATLYCRVTSDAAWLRKRTEMIANTLFLIMSNDIASGPYEFAPEVYDRFWYISLQWSCHRWCSIIFRNIIYWTN